MLTLPRRVFDRRSSRGNVGDDDHWKRSDRVIAFVHFYFVKNSDERSARWVRCEVPNSAWTAAAERRVSNILTPRRAARDKRLSHRALHEWHAACEMDTLLKSRQPLVGRERSTVASASRS
jgi:hypothetical protein